MLSDILQQKKKKYCLFVCMKKIKISFIQECVISPACEEAKTCVLQKHIKHFKVVICSLNGPIMKIMINKYIKRYIAVGDSFKFNFADNR